MIKSIMLNAHGLTCYTFDGSVINIRGENIPSIENLTQMLENIRRVGSTEILGLSSTGIKEVLEKLGIKTTGEDGSLHLPVKGGSVPLQPLENLITHSKATGQLEAVAALMERIANIDRLHSARDLVSFIEKAGMPLTVDGRLVAFKRVNKKACGDNYDVYSSTVLNNVGCRVHMNVEDVDPDRTKDCSYGLHVASRGYLRTFSGDTLLLILVSPENVIAVPEYDPTKVRVCSYDIVHEFSDEDKKSILAGGPLTDSVWQIMRPYIEGDQPIINKSVEVGKTINIISYTDTDFPEAEKKSVSDEYLKEIPKDKEEKQRTDLQKVIKETKKVNASSTFKSLYTLWDTEDSWQIKKSRFQDLLIFKRKQKKSWEVLGATEDEAKKLTKFQERIK